MERAMDFTEGEMEEKDLRKIKHLGHDHTLVLIESRKDASSRYGGGRFSVHCDGCGEPISSSSSSSGGGGGGGVFYACDYLGCWFLLHKRCAELPSEIKQHPSHPEHPLTRRPFLLLNHRCDVCLSDVNGFIYRCSKCNFNVHIRCASMALHIRDKVDENNKIHKHSLIPVEMEAQFLCAACGREHKGKSYLCSTCGFWANQICASAPTTVKPHSHPHPLALFRPASRYSRNRNCKICKGEVKRACWAYFCSDECGDSVHVDCSLSEQAENSNKDIQTNLHLETRRHKIDEMPSWPPVLNESVQLITQLIKNLSLQEEQKRSIIFNFKKHTKILRCKNDDYPLSFVNEKTDKSKDNQLCERCAHTISGGFYHCSQCKFSFHEGCAKLPNKMQHILHPGHALRLLKQRPDFDTYDKRRLDFDTYDKPPPDFDTYCHSCDMPTNRFVFGCLSCKFFLDLKCVSLPRSIKHEAHDHILALRMIPNTRSCDACGVYYSRNFAFFRCVSCSFGLCIKCTLLPLSVKHRYDKHPFTLTYSPVKGQPDEYYCEICEEDIDSTFWFYHCIECDQSLHPECIYPIERSLNVKFGELFKVDFHSHLLRCVHDPKSARTLCNKYSRRFEKVDCVAYKCEECDFWINASCLKYPRNIDVHQ